MAAKRGFDSKEPVLESYQLPSSPFNPDNAHLFGARDLRDVYFTPPGFGIVIYASTVNEEGQVLERHEVVRIACEHWAPRVAETGDCRFGCEAAT